MKKFVDQALGNTFLIGLAAWAVFVTVTDLWPVSRWLVVDAVWVDDAKAGEPLNMQVSRDIRSDFVGEWVSSVRSVDTGVVCTAVGVSNYRAGAQLPKPLTLGWWTNGNCPSLPPGRYFVATDWTIRAHGIWPEKRVKRDSNVFEVRP